MDSNLADHRAGNTGIDFVTSLDGTAPGPHVVLNAMMHGNEPCGLAALDFLKRIGLTPRRGRLTLAFANVDAGSAGGGRIAARFRDQDMNRLWSPELLDGSTRSVELERARRLRPVYESADFLLDLHSMQNGTVPLILCGPTRRARDFACRLQHPHWVVADAGHAAGPRLIDFGNFTDPDGEAIAVLAECGQHRSAAARRTAIETSLRFLLATGIVDAADVAPHLGETRHPAPTLVDVTHAITIATDQFQFVGERRGMEVVASAGTLIGRDGPTEIRTPYDECVLVMPSPALRAGQTAVRLGRIVESADER
jgi:predicted deacylase